MDFRWNIQFCGVLVLYLLLLSVSYFLTAIGRDNSVGDWEDFVVIVVVNQENTTLIPVVMKHLLYKTLVEFIDQSTALNKIEILVSN